MQLAYFKINGFLVGTDGVNTFVKSEGNNEAYHSGKPLSEIVMQLARNQAPSGANGFSLVNMDIDGREYFVTQRDDPFECW